MREEARQAVNAERTRIPRELHDVVAHSVSVMVVQAGAARRVLDKDPDRASEAMASIESTGRQSLNELRRLLGMLRQADGAATGRVPQPSIDDVDALLAQTREAGLPVTIEIEGEPRPLAPGVDLSAYRIVQEALTNTIKHAGPAEATVRLCYGADTLELVISDDGRGADCEEAERTGAAGHGLVGMRERVSLFGGDLQVGNRPGGGFTVRATLPLEATA
jgi:signal transduction histidine kinase